MQELIPLFKQFGVWVSVLILIAYFLLRHLWPHWKSKDLKEQDFRHKQSERIQEREDGILKDVAGLIRQNISESQTMTQRMDVMTEEIRAEHRERRRK